MCLSATVFTLDKLIAVKTILKEGSPFLTHLFEGDPSRSVTKFCCQKLEALRYHAVENLGLYLT